MDDQGGCTCTFDRSKQSRREATFSTLVMMAMAALLRRRSSKKTCLDRGR